MQVNMFDQQCGEFSGLTEHAIEFCKLTGLTRSSLCFAKIFPGGFRAEIDFTAEAARQNPLDSSN